MMTAKDYVSRTGLTVFLCNRTLTEIFNIHPDLPVWKERHQEVLKVETIGYYRITLQYMFVAEYCKLIAKFKSNFPDNEVSSLARFNAACLTEFPTFKPQHDMNVNTFNSIQQHPFSKKMLLERKKLLHSDGSINDPGRFAGMSIGDIDLAVGILKQMLALLQTSSSPLGTSIVVQIPDQTLNTQVFIDQHSRIKFDLDFIASSTFRPLIPSSVL
jgi:hypothetical protein